MNWELIQDTLHDWAAAQLGISVIWADQDMPRPAFPYATLKIIADGGVGVDEVRYDDPGGASSLNQFVVGQRQFTLSVQVYSRSKWPTQNAKFYLSKLRNALRKPTALALLAPADVKVIGPEQSQDLSGVGDGAMESRASLDIRMAASTKTADGTESYIRKVEVAGTVTGGTPSPKSVDLGMLGEDG
jgi:hypothetical protein